MAQDKKKALDDKTRKLAGGKVEEGKEHAAYQETQQQLLAIQAEQQQNLAVARAESKASFDNNQTLAQAAELGAISAAEAEQTAQAGGQVTLNPATQSVLAKYGVGQPKFQRTQSHNQQVTKQNITINNNITSNTTNDVKIPAGVGGPLQGRPLQFKDPKVVNSPAKASTTDKFKTWISSAFARQNEEGAKRDREYRQRESSLTKSANRMMKKLEDIGKTIGTRMDPRKIGSTWQSQLKTLLLLFGFGYLTSNWNKILERVAGVEKWVKDTWNYFTGNAEKGGRSFVSDIKSFLGGKDNETIFESLYNLFLGKDGFWGRFKDYMHNVVEDRKSAISMVKFPEINLDDMIGTIKGVGEYLGNILTALVSGTEGSKSIVSNQIKTSANKGAYEQTSKDESTRDTIKHTVKGESKAIEADKGIESIIDGSYRGLTRYALDDNGNLTNEAFGAEATVSQASDISRIFDEANHGKGIRSTELAAGLQRLFNSAQIATKEGNGIPVTYGFIKNWFKDNEIRDLQTSKNLKKVNYYAVARKKTEADFAIENADPVTRAIKAGTNQALLNNTPVIGDVAKNIKIAEGAGVGTAIGTLFGMPFVGTAVGGAVGWAASTPEYQALSEYLKGTINRATSNDYRVEYVRTPRPGDKIITNPETGEPAQVALWEITDRTVQKIADKVTGKENTNIDINDEEFVTSVQGGLQESARNIADSMNKQIKEKEQYQKAHPQDYNNNRLLTSLRQYQTDLRYQDVIDYDINSAYKQRDQFEKERSDRESWYEERHADDRISKFGSNVKGVVQGAYNTAVDTGEKIANAVGIEIKTDNTKPRETVKTTVNARKTSKAPRSQTEYVQQMRPLLVKTLKSKNFIKPEEVETYADLLTTQSGLESGWGQSLLSKKYNNYSGMTEGTAKYHKVDSISMTNKQGKDRNTYAVFNSVEDWADDYVEYLNRKWKAFNGDSSQYYNRLQYNGTGQSYATDPNYVKKNLDTLATVKNISGSIEPYDYTRTSLSLNKSLSTKTNTTTPSTTQSQESKPGEVEEKSFWTILKEETMKLISDFGGIFSGDNEETPVQPEEVTPKQDITSQPPIEPVSVPAEEVNIAQQDVREDTKNILERYIKSKEPNKETTTTSSTTPPKVDPLITQNLNTSDQFDLINSTESKQNPIYIFDNLTNNIIKVRNGVDTLIELTAMNGSIISDGVDAVNRGTSVTAGSSSRFTQAIMTQNKNEVKTSTSLGDGYDSSLKNLTS